MTTHVRRLRVDYLPIDSLKLNPRNARTHSDKQVAQIVASIQEFGFTNPILADENGVVIAGEGRLGAARQLGLLTVPVITLLGLSRNRKRALVLADNKIALNAGWNAGLLQIELGELSVAPDLDFDVSITGFETAEVDIILGEPVAKTDSADEPIDPDEVKVVVSKLGDLWQLGTHRLYCGDALEPESYRIVLDVEQAQMAMTDPPYNVRIGGHVSGLGAKSHDEFKMASGELSEAEFVTFLTTFLSRTAEVAVDGAIIEVCMDWRHMKEILLAAEPVLGKPINLCVWNKTNAGMGSLFRSKHEFIFVFKKGTAPHINNVELGKHGRWRTNVWDYAGANTFRRGRDQDLEDHPTVKPTAMIVDAILDCSKRGGIILDPFAGSGMVILAAERTGRQARAIELDPKFVDVAIKRWQRLGKGDAILVETGETFAEVAARRGQDGPVQIERTTTVGGAK